MLKDINTFYMSYTDLQNLTAIVAVFSCTFVVHLHVLSRTQTGITDWVRATENKIIQV